MDGVLRAEPAEKGVYDLTVSVHRDNGSIVSKTIKVTVRGTDIQELEEEKHDYMVVMAIFFIISISAIAVFILRDLRQNSYPIGGGNGKKRNLLTIFSRQSYDRRRI
jgi:hypothetical protein